MVERPPSIPRYVLDTAALFSTSRTKRGLVRSRNCWLKPRTTRLYSILYITLREQGEAVAQERLSLLQQLPLTRVESDPPLALATGRLKATYPLSLADCWVAALAERLEAVLVHKDPEFAVLGHRIESLVLPYKPAGT